ncbi:MAG TPA: xanthine dehydrogenase [Rhodospirillaceae bacterium]|nr:xanthine dehydrogenase [Alphaproteobacteria bacterium]OUT39393.1 MAG: xanthine dehydrogenase [Micavibrio sp. TMED2]HCI47296.1 xanthine dehydrogenase [Rhodospirillaceae bacterium]MAS48764.1 xanthine dehydrogenase [Alphaproteobacteria bacterium]MAX94371.1 xanthine dehydrogenase [Alphaproteobacteria bacterium]|tara:strand:+ start:5346 stop:6887 length:1542 start_codon:yes stop_codon:yes gene_type:complete
MLTPYLEHPEHILSQWLEWRCHGPVAIIFVIATEGGGVRAPGAMMLVSADGQKAGYISGGCIDADVASQAVDCLRTGTVKRLIYGRGSPFIDLPLPCGGMIEVMIVPDANEDVIRASHDRLAARQTVLVTLDDNGNLAVASSGIPATGMTFRYTPRLKLRIAGRGADGLALARLASANGIETTLMLRDGEDIEEGKRLGLDNLVQLTSPEHLPELQDDPWTAFLLAFHDHDWETSLLQQVLQGPAFYVGAVGSQRSHTERCQRLADHAVPTHQIKRIHGPVGLIKAMRDASLLAVSILAEIIEAYHLRTYAPLHDTALILLAAGASSRFTDGDKLLAGYKGRRVIDHAALALSHQQVTARIAVVPPDAGEADGKADHTARANALIEAGWQVVVNQDAASGMASSLAAGISAIRDNGSDPTHALVLLGDMPNIPDVHLFDLRDLITPERPAVMSRFADTTTPPAMFSAHLFDALEKLTGDRGAKQLFNQLENTATLDMPAECAVDIDTAQDLNR